MHELDQKLIKASRPYDSVICFKLNWTRCDENVELHIISFVIGGKIHLFLRKLILNTYLVHEYISNYRNPDYHGLALYDFSAHSKISLYWLCIAWCCVYKPKVFRFSILLVTCLNGFKVKILILIQWELGKNS